MLNRFVTMGRLTTTPELRTTKEDIAITRFCLAVEKNNKSASSQDPNFLDFVAWRQKAEFICSHFVKGQTMIVEGAIQTRSFKDSTGAQRKVWEVVVDEVYFAGKKEGKETPAAVTSNFSGDVPEAFIETFEEINFA